MSGKPIGFTEVKASYVRKAADEYIDFREAKTKKERNDVLESIKRDRPGWIARNIFRCKPIMTDEEALAYVEGGRSMAFDMLWWSINYEGEMLQNVRKLAKVADKVVRLNGEDATMDVSVEILNVLM